jgi:hypothetical protein
MCDGKYAIAVTSFSERGLAPMRQGWYHRIRREGCRVPGRGLGWRADALCGALCHNLRDRRSDACAGRHPASRRSSRGRLGCPRKGPISRNQPAALVLPLSGGFCRWIVVNGARSNRGGSCAPRMERFLTWSVCAASTLRSMSPPRRSAHHQLVANDSLCGQGNACRYALLLDLARYIRPRCEPFPLTEGKPAQRSG